MGQRNCQATLTTMPASFLVLVRDEAWADVFSGARSLSRKPDRQETTPRRRHRLMLLFCSLLKASPSLDQDLVTIWPMCGTSLSSESCLAA